jgi:hypothetical protein
MGNRSDRLHNIIETHQARYVSSDSTSNLRDRWLNPYDFSSKVEAERDASSSGHDKGGKLNKPSDYSEVLVQIEAEINLLKQRADFILIATNIIYLAILTLLLGIIANGNRASAINLWFFIGLPIYLNPRYSFLTACLDFLLSIAAIRLVSDETLTLMAFIAIAIAAIATYRIFGVYISCRAKSLQLGLMSITIPSHCTSEAEE